MAIHLEQLFFMIKKPLWKKFFNFKINIFKVAFSISVSTFHFEKINKISWNVIDSQEWCKKTFVYRSPGLEAEVRDWTVRHDVPPPAVFPVCLLGITSCWYIFFTDFAGTASHVPNMCEFCLILPRIKTVTSLVFLPFNNKIFSYSHGPL